MRAQLALRLHDRRQDMRRSLSGGATAVEAATRQWIEKFVIRERLCPFAAASKIHVVVDYLADEPAANWQIDPASDADRRLMLRGLQNAGMSITHLLSQHVPSAASSNLFLVWPAGLSDLGVFLPFVSAVTAHAGLASGAGGPEQANTPATAFPFHPAMGHQAAGGPSLWHALRQQTAPTEDFKFTSPFPMLHIIPAAELGRARKQLGSRAAAGGTHLLDRNLRLMQQAQSDDRQRWEKLLEECRQSVRDGEDITGEKG